MTNGLPTDGALAARCTRSRLAALALSLVLALGAAPGARAATDNTQFAVTAGSLAFGTAPTLPASMPSLTLNGAAQTLNSTMPTWQVVDATGTGTGWNVTVQGDSSAGKSAVFKEYCTDGTTTNGCDTAVGGVAGPGYVTTSPKAFAANSFKLNSTSAAFSAVGGSSGTAPTHPCNAGCNVDSATAVKIGTAVANAGMGTWATSGYSGTSLALTVPTTTKTIGTGNKVYHLDVVFTLGTGP